jgi:thiosulfate/3-mercaptopyruvate sulfurtransferase
MRYQYRKQINRMSLIPLVSILGLIFTVPEAVQAVPNGGYAHPEVLIQPEELKALVDKKDPNIRIIDIREKLKYLAGHVPGAVHIWRPDITDKNHPLPGMMAPRDQIENLMGSLGINEKNTLVIYSDGPDNGRFWWILAYYGFPLEQMRILDGGLQGWKVKAYPTEMITPKIDKSTFELPEKGKGRGPLLCSLPEVKSALKNPNRVVLDARSKKEFLGEELKEGAVKPGRIPGAIWVEWTETLVREGSYEGYWKSSEEIKRIFSAKGVTPDKEIYIHCQSGVRSAHSLVSLYLVGYPLEKLHNYDGSWIEWSRSSEAIETGPPIQ